MVRPAHAHPCATAHQPSLVAQKTHFGIRAFLLPSGLLSRLFTFHVLFLSLVVPYRVLSMHETDLLSGSNNFERQVSADSK